MAAKTVPVRLSYLLRPDLTASVKLVWLGLLLDRDLEHRKLYSPSRIQRRVGVSRPTVRKALRRLKEPCRPLVPAELSGLSQKRIQVDPDLITDSNVPAMARVLYCIILGLKQLKRADVLTSYSRIAEVVRLQPRTVRLALRALVDAGWLAIAQVHKRAPLRLSFPNPKLARQRAEVRRARQRLEKSKYRGEALALLWCDTLVASEHYKDDFFPGSFTNPLTNELLQADRFYFDHKVAIEFNGPQHDGPTLLFTAAAAEAQRVRDCLKQEICDRQGIALLTLRPEDLTFGRMRELLGSKLPLHDVAVHEPIVGYLEKQSRAYIESIQRIRLRSSRAIPKVRSRLHAAARLHRAPVHSV